MSVPAVSAHGATIPKIGFGTWQLRGETCARLVSEALKAGYTHIDTAQGYANEGEVGEGLKASGVSRDSVFITTKVRTDNVEEDVLPQSVEVSLKKLGVSQIDLLLLHWPNPQVPLPGTIRAINKVKRDGLVKHIGLSNYTIALLDEAWRLTTEPFVTEQIEYHPFVDQRKMIGALRRHKMAVTAYCPIALGKVVGEPEIEAIAKAHGKSAAQVTLRWLVQQPDVIAIPKTATVSRLPENLDIFDFALTDAEMARMSALTRPGSRLVNEPQWVPQWD